MLVRLKAKTEKCFHVRRDVPASAALRSKRQSRANIECRNKVRANIECRNKVKIFVTKAMFLI